MCHIKVSSILMIVWWFFSAAAHGSPLMNGPFQTYAFCEQIRKKVGEYGQGNWETKPCFEERT